MLQFLIMQIPKSPVTCFSIGKWKLSKTNSKMQKTSPDLTKVQIPVELKNLLLTAAPIYRKY